jgi:hypothetical protein
VEEDEVVEYVRSAVQVLFGRRARVDESRVTYRLPEGRSSEIDVVVRTPRSLIGVEAKSDFDSDEELRRGVGQALDYRCVVHESYIAVPRKLQERMLRILDSTDLGLISVGRDVVCKKKSEWHIPSDYAQTRELLRRSTEFYQDNWIKQHSEEYVQSVFAKLMS